VSYILVGVLLAIGLVILMLVLLKVARAARRLAVTRTWVNGEVTAGTGMLRARSAALRIAVRDRREKKTISEVTEA
jgi:hypothetical protein